MDDPNKDPSHRFYYLLGHCINRWAYLEENIFDFFVLAMGTSEKIAAILYYRTNGLKAHMELVDEITAACSLSQTFKHEWTECSKEINRLSSFRHFITHNPAIPTGLIQIILSKDPDGQPQSRVGSSTEWWEIRQGNNEMKRGKRKDRAEKVNDLKTHYEEVYAIEGRLLKLIGAIERHSELSSPSPVHHAAKES